MISCSGVCESGRRKWFRKRDVFVGLEVGDVGDAGGASVMKAVAFCSKEENIMFGSQGVNGRKGGRSSKDYSSVYLLVLCSCSGCIIRAALS